MGCVSDVFLTAATLQMPGIHERATTAVITISTGKRSQEAASWSTLLGRISVRDRKQTDAADPYAFTLLVSHPIAAPLRGLFGGPAPFPSIVLPVKTNG